jgi:O-antigen/teichoic acid export membrane protein
MLRRAASVLRSNARLSRNIVGTMGLKGASVLISVLATPAYISYFADQAALGAWFTVLSILNWILLFDFGIGNGLRNSLVPSLAIGDHDQVRKQVSSAYILLGCIAGFMLVVGWVLIGLVDWNGWFGLSGLVLGKGVLTAAMRTLFVGVVTTFWLGIVASILYALQRNILVSSFSLIANVGVYGFLRFGRTGQLNADLQNLAWVQVFSSLAPVIIATVIVFNTSLRDAVPSLRQFDRRVGVRISALGLSFFGIQLALLLISSSDPVLITHQFGPAFVVEQSVYYRVFGTASMVFLLFTQPMWSAITAAWVDGRVRWIRKARRFLNVLALVGSVCCFAITPFVQKLFDLWLGEGVIVAHTSVALLFALLASGEMFMYAATCVANGIGELRCQNVCAGVGAILKVPLALVLGGVMDSWSAVIVSHVLAIAPLVLLQPLALSRSLGGRGLRPRAEHPR